MFKKLTEQKGEIVVLQTVMLFVWIWWAGWIVTDTIESVEVCTKAKQTAEAVAEECPAE